jgi:hypothetical protein
MENINTYLKENLTKVGKNIFISPNISEKKLNNAVKACKITEEYNYVIAIYDNTIFGSAKEGIVFTGEKLVYKALFTDPVTIFYNQIVSAEHIEKITVNDNGKEKKEEFIKIELNDNTLIKLQNLIDCNYSELALILNSLEEKFEAFSNEDQLIALADMNEEIRINYLKIIVNMALSNDGKVDSKEFSEIILLMTRLKFTKEMRSQIREYISNENSIIPVDDLLSGIDLNCVPSHNKSIKISLVKDLLNINYSINSGKDNNCQFVEQHKKSFGVTDDEISLILKAIKNDYAILNEDTSDSIIAKNIKELSAKAGAVGVPIAAIYLSGSVIGMSAAGMTSGLASLGLGGILGFSSMATGIGVAVLIGVVSYKGIKHITGANEIDKYKTREIMLNEVLKQTQNTITILMEDVNLITEKLNEVIKKQQSLEDKASMTIEKLLERQRELQKIISTELKLYSDSGIELNRKQEQIVINKSKISCPNILDTNKLENITSEPSKKGAYNQILSYYEEKHIEEKDNENTGKTILKLKDNIPAKELETLAQIFQALGYFDTLSSITSSVKGLFK